VSTGTLAVARGGTGAATLAANKVLVGNGTTAVLQPTNLHWDNGNSRLGIGNVNPITTLHVEGSAFVQQSLIVPAGNTSGRINGVYIDAAPAYAGNVFISNGYNNLTSTVDSSFYGACSILLSSAQNNFSYIAFNIGATNTAPTEKMRIALNGNVGIQTNSPGYLLDIGGFQSTGQQTMRIATTSGNSCIRLMEANDTYGFSFQNIATSRLAIVRHSASETGAEALSISRGSGNVGIGITTPLSRLHVKESVNNPLSTQLLLQNEGTNSHAAGIAFQVSDSSELTTFAPKAAIVYERTNSNGVGQLKFFNRSTSDSSSFTASDERMRIANTGNVGVGVTNPSVKLHVDGEIGFTYGGAVRVSPQNATAWSTGTTKLIETSWSINNLSGDVVSIYTPGSGSALPRISATSTGVIHLNGNVGIGTTNPTEKLVVNGNVAVTGYISYPNSVLQVIYNYITCPAGGYSIGGVANTYYPAPLTVNITPKFTNSKVKVEFFSSMAQGIQGVLFTRLERSINGGAYVDLTPRNGSYRYAYGWNYMYTDWAPFTTSFVDTPNTTLVITYRIVYASGNTNAVYLVHQYMECGWTVTEIKQ
jgi:hypothetical protein